MKKHFVWTVVLLAGSLLTSLLLLETGLRVMYPHFSNYNLEMWRYFAKFKQYLPDENLPFVHYPNREGHLYGVDVRTNSMGFRDREFAVEKPAGKKRILVLGDSLVFGWGVPQDKTIPKVIENILNNGSDRYEIINTGAGNYNTEMEVELFKLRGLALNPDMVVLVYFVNDAEPTSHISWAGYNLKKHSLLIALLFDYYSRVREKFDPHFNWRDYYGALYEPGAPGLEASRRAIRELAAICRERNIKLVMASYPELHQLQDYQLGIATDYIAGMARECNAVFVDLLPSFAGFSPESIWVSSEDAHGNDKATGAAGRAISDAIIKNGLLDSPAPPASR